MERSGRKHQCWRLFQRGEGCILLDYVMMSASESPRFDTWVEFCCFNNGWLCAADQDQEHETVSCCCRCRVRYVNVDSSAIHVERNLKAASAPAPIAWATENSPLSLGTPQHYQRHTSIDQHASNCTEGCLFGRWVRFGYVKKWCVSNKLWLTFVTFTGQGLKKSDRTVRSAAAFMQRRYIESTGGAGYGNVHHQMLPGDESENLFRHVASPKTISVIGYVCLCCQWLFRHLRFFLRSLLSFVFHKCTYDLWSTICWYCKLIASLFVHVNLFSNIVLFN